MSRAGAAATFAALIALAGCGSRDDFDPMSQVGANPVLPEPAEHLMPDLHIPEVSGWPAGAAPRVPAGFRVQAMATGLTSPRNVLALPNGDLLVVQSVKTTPEPLERPKNKLFAFFQGRSHRAGPTGPTNQVLLLRDANGDGQVEGRTVLVDQLNSPFGIAWANNQLYVASTDAILRYPFTPGQTRIDAPAAVVTSLPAGPINHHWTKSLTASPDGLRLYVGIGSNSNAMERGAEAEADRAMIWEVDPATGAHRVFASGLRNPNGLTFHPGTNALWTVVNERDELGPNLVPDYMTSVRPGAFYGWPYSYYGQHLDPRVRPQRPDLVAAAIPPDYALSSHVAPLGLAFYTGPSFPAQYQGGAFVAEHGSWNREQLNGYKVVFVRFRNGRPVGQPVDFVTDFVNGEGAARGRPVGLTVDRTGALIIADDAGGTVWRVSFGGATPAPAQPPA